MVAGFAGCCRSLFITYHSALLTSSPAMWLDAYIDWFTVLIAVWLSSVGGVIGSFLNVVVYRLPLGMSLVHPGSRCSVCLTPIRWYDNMPVFGWFWLGGRCRACGSQISFRYPAVEALVSAFFILLFAAEFCFGGAREPWSAAQSGIHGPRASDLSTNALWMRYWTEVLLMVTLLGAALMEYDGRSVPRKLFWPTLLLSIAIPVIWRDARPLPFNYALGAPRIESPFAAQAFDLLLGAWSAMALGLLSWRLISRDEKGERPMLLALLAVGVTLGWQLTAAIGAVWFGGLIFFKGAGSDESAPRRRSLPSLALLTGMTLLMWRPLLTLVAGAFRGP